MAEQGIESRPVANDEDYFEAVPEREQRARRAPGGSGQPPEGRYQPPAWVRVIGIALIVCMVLLLVGAVLVGSLALLAYATPELSATNAQTFAVAGTPTVVVHGEAGSIDVTTGDVGKVAMRVTKRAHALTTGLAQGVLNAMTITATQSGNTITITEQVPPFDGSPAFESRSFQLDLTVPAMANLATTLNAGTLTANNLQGTMSVVANAATITIQNARLIDANLHTNAGSMLLQNVTLSGNATLASNAGNIELDGALAAHTALDVRVNSGSTTLALPLATSAHLDAQTTVGSIDISGWPIAVNQNVARASAIGDLSPNPSGSIIIRADVGSVTLEAR